MALCSTTTSVANGCDAHMSINTPADDLVSAHRERTPLFAMSADRQQLGFRWYIRGTWVLMQGITLRSVFQALVQAMVAIHGVLKTQSLRKVVHLHGDRAGKVWHLEH